MSLLTSLHPRAAALLERGQPLAYDALALGFRLLFGWQFFLTGRGKLLHLERTANFFATLGLPAPGAHALGIGLLEAAGGLLLIVGAGSRVLSALLAGTMLVALATAHRDDIIKEGIDGLFGAAPFPHLLAMLVLVVAGPGRAAVDHWLAARMKQTCQPVSAPR